MSHGDLYDAIFDDEAYSQLPAMVAAATGGRSCTLYHFHPQNPLPDLQFSYFSRSLIDDFMSDISDDIWMNAGMATGIVNKAIALDSFVPEPVYRASWLWNDLFRAHGDDTGHSLGIVHKMDGMVMCSAIQRSFSSGAFDREEVAKLDRLATDLHRVYRARHVMRRQSERLSHLAELLHSGGEKLLLVDGELRVIEGSPAALRLIERKDGIDIQEGRLCLADPHLTLAIRKAAEDTIHRRPTQRATFLCLRPSGAFPLHLLVLPAMHAARSSCVIVISDGQMREDRLQLWLRQHYGITPAEASVALALLAGRSPEEIGETRQVSVATVRSQIRQLLEKTGTNSVTQFIILLNAIG